MKRRILKQLKMNMQVIMLSKYRNVRTKEENG